MAAVDDVCVFSSGHLDITIALELSEYLVNETEYVPWRIGLESLRYISGLLEGHPDFMYFKVSTVCVKKYLRHFACDMISSQLFQQVDHVIFISIIAPWPYMLASSHCDSLTAACMAKMH